MRAALAKSALVDQALASFPVVAITGARQTGKSTLARAVGRGSERVYRTLDDLEVLERSRAEPDALVRSAERLTLDEVQRSPGSRSTSPARPSLEAPTSRTSCCATSSPWRASRLDAPQLLYWRTVGGEEVDLVIEWRGRLLPIEVKATAAPRLRDARSLQAFRAEYPEAARAGLLLHAGEATEWLTDGVLAVPWWRVIWAPVAIAEQSVRRDAVLRVL